MNTKILRILPLAIIGLLAITAASAEPVIKNQTYGEYSYALSARPELNITVYDWIIDNVSVKSNTSENWLIKNWTQSDQGLHNITAVGKNFSGGSVWNRWVVNITPVYNPDYEIWITNWSENYSLKVVTMAVTFDPSVIRVNSVRPLAETGDIVSLLFGPTMTSSIDNVAGTVNITITAPLAVFSQTLPPVYVAKINYSPVGNQIVPMQRFDFSLNITDWNNTIHHQWGYYSFTGPNPPYNAKEDNVIDAGDILAIADCLWQDRIDCQKRKMIGGGSVDIRDLVAAVQRIGQTFYHKW